MEPCGSRTPKEQPTSIEHDSVCRGGNYAASGSEGGEACFPGEFMAGMAGSASEDTAAACPMAMMCARMMKGRSRGLGILLLIPAAVLLTLGAAILLVPKILTWLVAAGLIFLGGLILVAAHRIRWPGATAA